LAWPLAALGLAFYLRAPLFNLLGRNLKRIKAGPVELEWSEAIAEAVETLAEAPGAAEDTQALYSLYTLAEAAPSAAVLESFARLERALADKVGAKGGNPRGSARDLSQQALTLGVLPADFIQVFDNLRHLRNRAAHRGVAQRTTSPAEARQYVAISESFLDRIEGPEWLAWPA
jgi:hypothetical protein